MSANLSWNTPTPIGLRAGAGTAVIALHLAAVGAILLAKPNIAPVSVPETVEVRFVEIAPTVQIAPAPPAPTPPAPPPPPKPPEPKPKPKPPKPVPKPKPAPRPEPVQPAPEPVPSESAISTPPAPPVPIEPAPVESAPPSGKPEAAERTAAPQLPVSDQPRMVGQIDYLGAPPMPTYPRTSRRLREEGSVLVRVLINARGLVESASIEKSSGSERLDEASLAAARRGRFKPYTVNGVATPAYTNIPFNFTIKD